MEKILKILHKKLDEKPEKNQKVKENLKIMEDTFKVEKLKYEDKTPFSYFLNEITQQGIINKRRIEKAYKEGSIKMHDYYSALDYKEKKRLMNYEISEGLKELSCFVFQEQRIYIPFFDMKMNAIYENEMVLFDLKQYQRIMLSYEDLMHNNIYGSALYNSSFSSLTFIYEEENKMALFSKQWKRLYFIEDNEYREYISIDTEEEVLKQISIAYLNDDKETFVSLFETNCLVNEKLVKKLKKTSK